MNRKVSRLPEETVEAMKTRAVQLVPTAALWCFAYASRESSRAVFERCNEAMPMLH